MACMLVGMSISRACQPVLWYANTRPESWQSNITRYTFRYTIALHLHYTTPCTADLARQVAVELHRQTTLVAVIKLTKSGQPGPKSNQQRMLLGAGTTHAAPDDLTSL